MAAEKLAEVLAGIWSAQMVPIVEKRRMSRMAIAMVLGVGQVPVQSDAAEVGDSGAVIQRFEECLDAAGCAFGSQSRPSISEVKRQLRARNRSDLASRLSRLSKARNGQAHPDLQLAGLIAAALAGTSTGANTTGNSATDDNSDSGNTENRDNMVQEQSLKSVRTNTSGGMASSRGLMGATHGEGKAET